MIDAQVARVAAAMGVAACRVTPLAGGFSHRTVLVDSDGGKVVMRFGGPSPAIEAAVMARAADVVAVPDVRAVFDDCLVIDHVDGVLLAEAMTEVHDLFGLGQAVGASLSEVSTIGFDRPGFFTDDELTVGVRPPWSALLPQVAAACMATQHRLGPADQQRWLDKCTRSAPALSAVDAMACLVHSDANPKNVLVRRRGTGWELAALLDWEFAFSGCPYADGANMLRFAQDYPPEFVRGFRAGFGTAGEELGRVFDLFALSQLLTTPAGHAVGDRVEHLVREMIGAEATGPRR